MIITAHTYINGDRFFEVQIREDEIVGYIERNARATPYEHDYFWRLKPFGPEHALSADVLIGVGVFVQSLNANLLIGGDQ